MARVLCFAIVGETTSFPSFDQGWGGDSRGRVRRIWAPFTGQMECQSSASTQMRSPREASQDAFRWCGSVVPGLLWVHWEYFVLLPTHPLHPLAPLQIPPLTIHDFFSVFPLAPQVYYLYLLSDPLFFFFFAIPSFLPVGFKFLSRASHLLLSTIFQNILQPTRLGIRMGFGGLPFYQYLKEIEFTW